MKILFCWTGLTSYMGDCWRHLAAEPGVELKVWIDASGAAAQAVAFDAGRLMAGVACEVVDTDARSRREAAVADMAAWQPDILFAVGWRSRICRAAVEDRRLRDIPKVCCFDMPWRWKLRCLAAPLVLRGFLRRYDAAFVPGAVCARYARWLGFRRVQEGLFAIDTSRFSPSVAATSLPQSAGGYFLYLGRNAPEKRLGDLRAAHARYRARGGRFPLRLHGKGLEDGFAAPEDVPALLKGAVAIVLASDFDPWPLVLLEAMAAGCPVIASDRCTNRPELGRNWRVFPCGDVEALARALRDLDDLRGSGDGRAKLEQWRDENQALAKKYDCTNWVREVMSLC